MNAITLCLLSLITTAVVAQEPGKDAKPAAPAAQQATATKTLALGQRANGALTLPDIDGKLHSLSDYRGKKVFLFSWGSY